MDRTTFCSSDFRVVPPTSCPARPAFAVAWLAHPPFRTISWSSHPDLPDSLKRRTRQRKQGKQKQLVFILEHFTTYSLLCVSSDDLASSSRLERLCLPRLRALSKAKHPATKARSSPSSWRESSRLDSSIHKPTAKLSVQCSSATSVPLADFFTLHSLARSRIRGVGKPSLFDIYHLCNPRLSSWIGLCTTFRSRQRHCCSSSLWLFSSGAAAESNTETAVRLPTHLPASHTAQRTFHPPNHNKSRRWPNF